MNNDLQKEYIEIFNNNNQYYCLVFIRTNPSLATKENYLHALKNNRFHLAEGMYFINTRELTSLKLWLYTLMKAISFCLGIKNKPYIHDVNN